jgi:transposase InsO family protein
VLHALQAQEQRRLMRQDHVVEGALQAKHHEVGSATNSQSKDRGKKKNYPPCEHCSKMGHPPFRCWRRPDAKCSKCNQLGHEAVICKSKFQQQEVNAQVVEPDEDQMFVATCFSTRSSSECWLIDSGCTNHMTYDRTLFKDLTPTQISKVRIGNGVYIAAKGKGTVVISTSSGIKTISDVLYVPDIDQNLLSVGQLIEKGFKVSFENKLCIIFDTTGREILRVNMKGKSFSFDPVEEEQNAYVTEVSPTELWHKRLGHCHIQRMMNMKKNDMTRGIPILSDHLPNCNACQFGKQNRKPFPKTIWRASQKLQLIHTDVAGPQRTPSLQGSLYFILFIDDFTRMCWIFFLKFKHEVAGVFVKFKNMVETQSGCKIQFLRSDNGKEYTSTQFNLFCDDAGIVHQLTTPYTPQQNGVSERRNRSVMEMARCMLHEKDLPKPFWAEAANTAVFLQNRLPTKVLKDKTPFEAWYGYKPSVTFLKVFGCVCFAHVPQVKRDKLDKKAIPGIFVGYSSVSKAYKVYHPQSGKMTVSRDVHFIEDQQWDWKNPQRTIGSVNDIEDDHLRKETTELCENELEDDPPIRGTRLVSDIYQRCNVAVCEPACCEEALKDPKWKKAMEEEMSMIQKNQTWELVDKPGDRKIIGVKWVFRTKLNADCSINKYKARLVVKGYAQIFGVDYSDTFAPVSRLDTIRLILAVAAQKGWKVFQLDVKSAFLNGVLEEEIYVEQPEGFVVQGEEDKVYLLKKALYGLKQAPRAWYSKINDHLLSIGFVKSLSESTLYVKHKGNNILIISLYVDDLLVTGDDTRLVEEFKQEMMQVFEMTDLGLMTFFLGIEIKQNETDVFICQKKYAREILTKFQMEECKAVSTPMNQKEKLSKEDGAEKIDEGYYRSLIGCLMYLTATRPDILFAVSMLSRFMHCASEMHLKAARRILRYIKGTVDYGVKFERCQKFKLCGFSDSDWAGSIDDMKSTSGYCFSLGSGVFSWSTKKQETVAQSTAEAEFIAATAAVNQVLWLKKILHDLHLQQNHKIEVFIDNQAAIAISKDPVCHGKTKHFNIKLYFLREMQQNGEVTLVYCKSEDQLADLFTKPLPVSKFEFLRQKIGVCRS